MSINPLSGQLTEDPLAGFLPPNDAEHRGEGFMTFTAQLLTGLDGGTQLLHQATIVFDPAGGANPPIDTNQTLNTIGDVVVTDLTPGRGTNKTTFIDLDGDPVQVTFGGKAGSAQVIRLVEPDGSGDIVEITLTGTDARSSLAIKTRGKGSETSVGDIVVNGPLKRIAAKTTNLVGDLTVDEWLGKLLLAAGANAAAPDRRGNTPLHRAAAYGRIDVAKLLLDAGANVLAENRNQGTVLETARAFPQPETAAFLERHVQKIKKGRATDF